MPRREPRLRTADRFPPPYPLGNFPRRFVLEVGRQIIYIIATKGNPTVEGPEWEQIFARAIGAEWRPSNVGLDDIILRNCAWGAKTVKNNNPWNVRRVRLISGRNSPVFSYGDTIDTSMDPNTVGEAVLNIWNARVDSIRAKHSHARTVVLIKSNDLLRLTVFEMETLRYEPDQYTWVWNKRENLEGYYEETHRFTWQPHGSQFTIIEMVPENKVCIRLREPDRIDQEEFLRSIGFEESWVQVVSNTNTEETQGNEDAQDSPEGETERDG